MKFTAASVVAVAALVSTGSHAFTPSAQTATRRAVHLSMSTTEAPTEGKKTPTKKEKRLQYMKTDTFHRRGFKEVRENVENAMDEQFKSELVDELRTNDFVVQKDGVKVHLAKDYGFCWGVERSIALAYEAVEHFPGKTVHITNELIHNPEVNDKLHEMDVQFIEKLGEGKKDFSKVKDGDVVILPAFGASFEEMTLMNDKNVDVVDTTCPWVSKVWNTVDQHQRKGLTSVIHGKYAHEETVATTSFCEDYICVKDMKEAEMVADYIVNGGDKAAFLEYFKNAISEGFDPDTMLQKVGLANQTTMYKKETRAIGQLMQKAMIKKFGPVDAKDHYLEFDTICDATQERQDAIHELVENADELGLDFILVVGGWDSSNTAHLLEIPQKAGVRSFHINKSDCIGADNTITHRTMSGEIVTEKFILDIEDGDKEVVMGVTSGASTPDKAVQDSLSSIFLLKKMSSASP
jgi:4-hydroxy-3-methylbut-2-enyl diphosphate reductase